MRAARASAAGVCLGLVALMTPATSASAFTYAEDGAGTSWGVQDSAPPGTDTGSIRATQTGRGVAAPYSTTLNGYGGLRVTVPGSTSPSRPDGELLRGFGLVERERGRFESTRSVDVGGVRVSRTLDVRPDDDWGRWLDTVTNTTRSPVTVEVAFGGQTGWGATGTNASRITATSSGDAVAGPEDTWTATTSGTADGRSTGGPTATVAGTFDRTGDWLQDTFVRPLATEGHGANYPAYVHRVTLAPRQSASLLHYLVVGQPVTPGSSAGELAAVTATAAALTDEPVLDGLSREQICSVTNMEVSPSDVGLAACRGLPRVMQPATPQGPRAVTRSPYDVVDRTIEEMRADLQAGRTTSAEITRAYLDRIAAYDEGQLGFDAFTTVAGDAMQQARAADRRRARGESGALLGIPVAVKDLYDTADMPTTNGSLTFAGFRPREDAYQVARLRQAGAVVIGKASMEEYATSGSYSDSAFGTVWNAFDPSRSALASSGGSGVATATSMAAAALGSQTGDSLYAPAAAASLVTLRGTDGMQSDRGVMPLTWLQDYPGAMTRSVSDLADMLNVTSGTDPQNPETALADRHRPYDWRSVLDGRALEGKKIGLLPSAWTDPYGTTTTLEASREALGSLEAAGAEVVELAAGPVAPARPDTGDLNWEGWARYLASHPEAGSQLGISTPADVVCSQRKLPYTRLDPAACEGRTRITPAQEQAWRDYRTDYQEAIAAWMDAADVDAVVYPGLLSGISLNDGGGNRSSFGRRDTPSGASGTPTVMVPVGLDADEQPVGVQLLGRAWDDAALVGMAYALEQQVGDGHVAPGTTPALRRAGATG